MHPFLAKCKSLSMFKIICHGHCHFGDQYLLFVWFDSLHPSQQFFSHLEMGLPGLNQY